MKKLPLCLLLFLSCLPPASSFAAPGEAGMVFSYQPMESAAWPCEHKRIRDLPDWTVTCESQYGTKTFTAHVIVRESKRPVNTGLEILYWVTAPGDTETSPRKYDSTSALINLSGQTKLEDFSFSQGVENDAASLTLRWRSE